jgi:L-proline amide hydrolase
VRTADWLADARQRIASLPDSTQRAITDHEKAGTTDAPDYKAAINVYYSQYVYHAAPPYPANVDSSDSGLNLTVSDQMWG